MGATKYYYDTKDRIIDIVDTEYSKDFKPTENHFEIDENLVFIIHTLNEKGYKTMFCCEGHAEIDGLSLSYIAFENGIKLPSCPENWCVEIDTEQYDENDNIVLGHWETLRANRLVNLNDDEFVCDHFYKEKFKALLSLFEWVETLEDLTNKED